MTQRAKRQYLILPATRASRAAHPTAEAGASAPSRVPPRDRRAWIAERAYFRSLRRGSASGSELEDWLAAESEFDEMLRTAECSQK